jgi:hypothetical protein
MVLYETEQNKKRKLYQNFGNYLGKKKHKLKNSYRLAGLFLQKFAETGKPDEWQTITAKDLKEAKIDLSDYQTYYNWRQTMLKKGVLICQATAEEFTEDVANHKCNKFKPTPSILNYIEKLRWLNVPDKLDKVENNVQEINEKLNKTNEALEKVLQAFFKLDPPDTAKRRKELFEL